MLEKLNQILLNVKNNKVTSMLFFAVFLVLLVGGFFIFKNLTSPKHVNLLPDITLNFDPEGPYAVLTPRKDGNALTLNVKRIASYDAFSYVITYNDETGIDRGAGDLNTWIDIKDKRSDYEQENILFGSCSKGAVADPTHCVFDKGVENGTMALRVLKGNQPYLMNMQWHLQKPDIALGSLSSGDGHLLYQTTSDREKLNLVGFTIINDLNGAPKLPEGKAVSGKVYSLNAPAAKQLPSGMVTIELPENASADAKIERYGESANSWEELTTKVMGAKLEASASAGGIFAVLVNSKK